MGVAGVCLGFTHLTLSLYLSGCGWIQVVVSAVVIYDKKKKQTNKQQDYCKLKKISAEFRRL